MLQEEIEHIEVASSNGRPTVVELKDHMVTVKTFHVSMSSKQKWTMVFNLVMLSLAPGSIIYSILTSDATANGKVCISVFGVSLYVLLFLKTINDFRNWKLTVNKFLNDVGAWYCEDVRAIVSDLLSAGAKFAEQEVAKAIGKEVPLKKEKEIASEAEKKD